jgi:hypothetical protein
VDVRLNKLEPTARIDDIQELIPPADGTGADDADEEKTYIFRLKYNRLCKPLMDYIKRAIGRDSKEDVIRVIGLWRDRFNRKKDITEKEEEMKEYPSYMVAAIRTYNQARNDIIESQIKLLS